MKFLRKIKKLIGQLTRALLAMGAEKWKRKPGFDPTRPPRKGPFEERR